MKIDAKQIVVGGKRLTMTAEGVAQGVQNGRDKRVGGIDGQARDTALFGGNFQQREHAVGGEAVGGLAQQAKHGAHQVLIGLLGDRIRQGDGIFVQGVDQGVEDGVLTLGINIIIVAFQQPQRLEGIEAAEGDFPLVLRLRGVKTDIQIFGTLNDNPAHIARTGQRGGQADGDDVGDAGLREI